MSTKLYRRAPARNKDKFSTGILHPENIVVTSTYYQVPDLLHQELADRFNQTGHLPPHHIISPVKCYQWTMFFQEQLEEVKSSCNKNDFDFDHLKKHLSLLVDVVKQGTL